MNRRDFIYAASAGAASAAASPVATFAQNNPAAAPDARQSAVKLRTITLEEHFATPAFAAGPGKGLVERLRSSAFMTQLGTSAPLIAAARKDHSITSSARLRVAMEC